MVLFHAHAVVMNEIKHATLRGGIIGWRGSARKESGDATNGRRCVKTCVGARFIAHERPAMAAFTCTSSHTNGQGKRNLLMM